MQCIHCRAQFPVRSMNVGRLMPCPYCGARLRIEMFPAAFEFSKTVDEAKNLGFENEAGCFYHPGKKALVSCSSCGRFLCALCDVDMDGTHLCFSCLESGKKKRKLVDLESHRTLYDGIAIRLAVWPLITIWFTMVTAPMALYVVFRYWGAPSSILPRTKIRFVMAGLLSAIQVVGWGMGIYYLSFVA